MGDLSDVQRAGFSKLTNEDENLVVDVVQDPVDAIKRLQTSSKNDPQGLKGQWIITTILVTDVQTPLPATPLTDRNFVYIENTEPSKEVWVGPSGLTADRVVGTTSGKKLDPDESVKFDFKDNLLVYGRCEAGKTAIVRVIEAQ